MKFFTKYKQIFRAIIAEEVSKLDTSLRKEKESLQSHLLGFDTQLQAFNTAVEHFVELSYFKENAELRDTIKKVAVQSAGIVDIVKKLHPIA